jgi:hypothetical protein
LYFITIEIKDFLTKNYDYYDSIMVKFKKHFGYEVIFGRNYLEFK